MKQSATPDSSFWINAHRSGFLHLVLERYEVSYAPAVAREMRVEFPSGREFWRLVQQGLLTEVVPNLEIVEIFGPGERAAINLALEHKDWVLLIDDRRPFLEAERLGIKVICTPVLIMDLYSRGRLTAADSIGFLARLAALQTVSPALIAAALAQLSASHRSR